ncbi:MAG: nucleoside triphosphate pyrophosphohydrolase family protein, partial [Fulvivirga sp.]
MQQPDSLNQVADFHKTFKHPILESPGIPDEKRCALRVELIAEELKELEEAIKDKDLVEVADALCDIQYVLSGAILEFGLGDKFKALFDEVQR